MTQTPIVLTVSDLTCALKSHIEPIFRHVCVRGEISNFKLQTSGHQYFSLIDERSQLQAVLFKGNSGKCTTELKNGDTVLATGEISLYPPRGIYQLVVRQIAHVGLGEALLKLMALKKKLLNLGWFGKERKRSLPPDIRRIGLVTSPTGAVLHDIYTILCRRMGNFHLIINPVKVQGEGAAFEIARAISEFSFMSLVDVVIVCRGGGSSEDLAAFNEEIVAKACYECTIPIISAVGHETDNTIVDLVADLRAPTPSAAAELVSLERGEQRRRLEESSRALITRIVGLIGAFKVKNALFAKQLSYVHPKKIIEGHLLRLDELSDSTQESILRSIIFKKQLLERYKKNLDQLSPSMKVVRQRQAFLQIQKAILDMLQDLITEKREKSNQRYLHIISLIQGRLIQSRLSLQAEKRERLLTTLCRKRISSYKERLSYFAKNLSSLNPKKVLERGYAIVFTDKQKSVVRSIQMATSGDAVKIMLADGTIQATVQ